MRAMLIVLALFISGLTATAVIATDPGRQREALRVCSDPNNLPFSNAQGAGFENKLAEVLARHLGARLQYTWWAQRRGFVRNTLNAGVCDVVMGYPSGSDIVQTTAPYYRSTYVFLSRRARKLRVRSFDDPVLRQLRIGVQLVGDDGANAPPAHALSRRGLADHLVGYTVYGDYRINSPPSAIVTAVARGDIDVAAVWGPLAGYFAYLQSVPLDLTPVEPRVEGSVPQTFSISMAVRRPDGARKRRLDEFLHEHRGDINRLLAAYHVPIVKEE